MNEIRIKYENGKLNVPDKPIIPFIEGNGSGPVIWEASKSVIDTAVYKTYGSFREIHWKEIFAGEKALAKFGKYLPEETIQSLKKYVVGIKGSLKIRVDDKKKKEDIDIALRQQLNLNVPLRLIRWYEGIPYPEKSLSKVDLHNFIEEFENSEVINLNSSSNFQNLGLYFKNEISRKSPFFTGKRLPGARMNLETGISIFEPLDTLLYEKSSGKINNPFSQVLSGAMMLEYLGWIEAADKILQAFHEAVNVNTYANFTKNITKWEYDYPHPEFAMEVLKYL